MSIKIYNAYKVKDVDFLFLLEKFKKYREEYLDLVFDFLKTSNAIKEFDWFELVNKIKESCEKNSSIDSFNFNGCIMVYPHRTGIYFQIFGMDNFPEWSKKLKNRIKRYSKDFYYFNNIDKPKGISNEEWKDRRIIWDSIFKKSDVPVLSGFCFSIFEKDSCAELYIRACKDAKKMSNM